MTALRHKWSFKSDSIRGLLSRPKAHLHKLQFYEKLPTVRQIVLAYADRKRVEHHRRTEKGWEGEVLSTSESTLVLMPWNSASIWRAFTSTSIFENASDHL